MNAFLIHRRLDRSPPKMIVSREYLYIGNIWQRLVTYRINQKWMSLLATFITCQRHAKNITTSAESTIPMARPSSSTFFTLEFCIIFFQHDCFVFDTFTKFIFAEIS